MPARKLIPDLFFSLLFGLVIMLVISLQECGCNLLTIPGRWLLFTLLVSASLYYVNTRFARLLQHRLNNRWHRFLLYTSASPVLTVSILFLARYLVFGSLSNYDPLVFFWQESWQIYMLGMLIALVSGSGFYAFYAFRALKEEQIEQEKAKSSQSETKFIHLKNQIDPHFLFNSLNVLSSLIEEDSAKAFRYTNSLSTIYRSMLSQKDKTLVPLSEELATSKEYLYLVQIRFEDSLNYIMQPELHAQQKSVVPLSLQLLLENVIKHNEASEIHPLTIRIYSENEYLIVENNRQPRTSFVTSSKLGLSIITERYKSITNRPVIVEKNDRMFRVSLPLITHT